LQRHWAGCFRRLMGWYSYVYWHMACRARYTPSTPRRFLPLPLLSLNKFLMRTTCPTLTESSTAASMHAHTTVRLAVLSLAGARARQRRLVWRQLRGGARTGSVQHVARLQVRLLFRQQP